MLIGRKLEAGKIGAHLMFIAYTARAMRGSKWMKKIVFVEHNILYKKAQESIHLELLVTALSVSTLHLQLI